MWDFWNHCPSITGTLLTFLTALQFYNHYGSEFSRFQTFEVVDFWGSHVDMLPLLPAVWLKCLYVCNAHSMLVLYAGSILVMSSLMENSIHIHLILQTTKGGIKELDSIWCWSINGMPPPAGRLNMHGSHTGLQKPS